MAKPTTLPGICHLCGLKTDLTFEHVPPKGAFNDKPAFLLPFEELIHLGPDDEPQSKPRKQQRGMGGYTLCDPCNTKTGHRYGSQFVQWSYAGAMLLDRSDGKPTLHYPYWIQPLPILKQIISCFFSVNSSEMQQRYPDLARFVLDKEARYLSPRYRFFAYYNTEGRPRMLPLSRHFDIISGRYSYLSEITTFPFGYVMTIDSDPPDRRLAEISHFARYEYDEGTVLSLRFPVLPTHITIHGDYRTKEEVNRDASEEDALERKEELMRKMVSSGGVELLARLATLGEDPS